MSARRGSRLGAVGALLALLATLLVVEARPAAAAITIANGGFETGLSGWSATTNAQAIGTDGGVVPREGSRMAKMTAGTVNTWYSVSQSFTAGAGESVGGWAYFKAGDYMPYNDTGQVVVQQGSTVVATPFHSSVSLVGDYGGSTWKRWRHTFTASGTYTVVARVRNDLDSGFHSLLYVDRVGQVFDSTAPVVEPVITGTLGANGWYTSDASLTWSVTDPDSTVDGTFGCSAATITTDTGGQSYSCSAWSEGGETNRTVTIKRDATKPTLSFGAPAPGATGGWNKTDVSIPYGVTDNLSGVASATPGTPVVVSDEGSPVTRTVTVVDKAGNSAAYTTPALSIDKTAPTITGSRAPAANGYGWNNADVTVSFVCDDGLSGVSTCSAPTTLASEGAAQTVTGAAADNAGNASSAAVSGINIDKTAPALVGTPTTSANANGWYNGDVLIGWAATDALAGVDPAALPATSLVTSEGPGLTATASVVDRAGNPTVAISAAVDIDKTAPSTTASAPGGWVNGAATVTLAPADALSGVAGTSYSLDGGSTESGTSVTIATEGIHTLRFWSTDNAGNVEAPKEVSVKIDTTAPTIAAAQSPAKNANGWNNTEVTVSFVCGDSLSGIASCTAPVVKNLPGEDQPVTGTAVDNAGNSAEATALVSIDLTAPTISASRTPAGSGWSKVPVVVGFACADDLSGVAACADAVTLGHGADQAASGAAADAAGNVASAGVADVDVDLHAPTITGAPTSPANEHGWYASSPTVHFTCADDLSGVASCSPDAAVAGEGADLSATGVVADAAGNNASTTVGGLKVDTTGPTITATPDRAPDADGWYRSPVTFTYQCADTLSGVLSCPSPKTFDESGANQGAAAAATDKAGHSTSYAVSGVNVDLGAPTIVGEVVEDANAAGWHKGDVTVRFTCTDDFSGIVSCPDDIVVASEGENQSVSADVSDNAGNTATATVTGINIDKTAPAITGGPDRAANADGWYNAPVVVSFSCSDALSHTESCTTPVTVDDDGAGIAVQGHAVDKAGNSARFDVTGINLDQTGPSIAGAASPAPNGAGWNNSDVTVSFTCADGLSEVASCSPPTTVAADGADQAVTGTAVDKAGNVATATLTGLDVDKTPPGITGARHPAPNAHGWNNTAVTATFTCTDALSQVVSCPDPVTVADEGAGQSVTRSALDAADNTASATVSEISIDVTAPVLAGTPATTPNGAGWYNGDVVIAWSESDTLSGIDPATVPGDSVIGGEGSALSAGASVSDRAGNTTSAVSPLVKIDRTAPTTTTAAPSDWQAEEIVVGLSSLDNLSGVASTHWTLDGGPAQTGDAVPVGDEGEHTIRYWSVDHAGNAETPHEVVVKVDRSNPTITHVQDPEANAAGWNNSDVTVTFTCADAVSGIASCTSPQTLSAEGGGQVATGTAVDNAGRTATDAAVVSIDKTAPTIGAARLPLANEHGWNNADVTVTFTCADDRSGVASCTAPVTLGEGTGGSALGTAVDAAGNSAGAGLGDVNVDKTAPAITGAATTEPNAYGWYAGPVTVHFECADERSGVLTCPADVTLADDGPAQSVTGTVTDKAGNTATFTVPGINIDQTAPTLTGAPTTAPNGNGWYDDAVTVRFSCQDSGSGVGERCPADILVDGDGAALSVGTEVTDLAGNRSEVTVGGINIDRTAPVVVGSVSPSANAEGWHNTAVEVSFACSDNLSGVESCSAPVTLAEEGSGQSAGGMVVDKAGNTATTSVTGIDIDLTLPTIAGARTPAANAHGWNNGDVTVGFDCGDALSGVRSCTDPVVVADEGADQSVVGNVVDVAGNAASATVGDISIDKTVPTLSAAPSTPANSNGWYNTDVTMQWTAGDDRSGVDESTVQPSSTITGEGTALTVSESVSDKAGNVTTASSPSVAIDRTAPVTGVSAPSAWVNGAAVVTLSPSDGLSGVDTTFSVLDGGASVAGTSVAIAEEGVHTLRFWTVDKAGNAEPQQEVTVRIDLTAPTITHSQLPEKNGAGWNNTDVKVTFVCGDNLSGVASCSTPHTFTAEGAPQSVVGTATDEAGNSAEDTATVSIDKTAPTVGASRSPLANGFGWVNRDVTVTFTCDDDRSGVAECADAQVFGEGTGQVATGSTVDNAGNSASTQLGGIDVDKTAPTISGTATTAPNAEGWYSAPVTVRFTCADDRSGVVACPEDVVLDGNGADQSVTRSVEDKAGNTATATVSGISIDRTAPVIAGAATTAPNARGWYRTPVTVSFTCTDATSGVGDRCPVDVVLDGNGADQSVTRSVTDLAGNTSSVTVGDIDIDRTAPVVTWTGNAGTYTVADTVAISCTAGDEWSGVHAHSCQDVEAAAWSFALGENTRSASAEDRAGNTSTASTTFSVAVTFDSLCTLTERFSASPPIAGALCAKLAAAENAEARGNATAEAGELKAYTRQLAAQNGKAFTVQEVTILTNLAGSL